MPRRRNRTINQIDKNKIIGMRKQMAKKTKRGIALFVSLLMTPCLILIFNIGESFYPSWLITHRTQIIGALLLAIIVVIVSSPLIIEVNSNPRPLSGPGKNPKLDLWK